jgi:hypothetical protein
MDKPVNEQTNTTSLHYFTGLPPTFKEQHLAWLMESLGKWEVSGTYTELIQMPENPKFW